MAKPRISVVICTFDRPQLLEKCLASLHTQTLPAEAYEVCVVDNGPDPAQTAAVVNCYAGFHYHQLDYAGLSAARNVGWQMADGNIVAYLDDDAVADQHWLEAIESVFSTRNPKPGSVGGPVRPIWPQPQPVWLNEEFAKSLGIVDWGSDACVLERWQWIPGCNMAYPRDLLAQVGGFRGDLGRKGSRLYSMEETAIQEQLIRHGCQLYYHPRVSVQHHIAPDRLNKSWFVRHAFWNGMSRGILERKEIGRAHCLRKASSALRAHVFSPNALGSLFGRDPAEDSLLRRCITVGWLGYSLAMIRSAVRI